jgi:hypothetical protein
MTGGFIDPNFPNPNGPDDASIIIYGYVEHCICMSILLMLTVEQLHTVKLACCFSYSSLWSSLHCTLDTSVSFSALVIPAHSRRLHFGDHRIQLSIPVRPR